MEPESIYRPSKNNYIYREISAAIDNADKYFSVITLTGPRQSGKSTLFRHLFPQCDYVSLEDLDIRDAALRDPRGFLAAYPKGLIIDEVQHVPQLLSYIQGIVDNDSQAKFYLTGSSDFSLLKSVTQSLAGRTALFGLLPLSLKEIASLINHKTTDELIYSGCYPAVWSDKNIPSLLYPAYVKTYLERDARDLLAIKDLDAFRRFLRLCAIRIGSIFNASELSNEIGVAVNTINSWLSVLQASYIIYLLPPFYTNTRKRLTKSPKLYFYDCGLASYLLDIDSPQMLNRDKMRGHLFENMIINNFIKQAFNLGKSPQVYFYRDSNGVEVDLLVKNGGLFDCYEIKSAATFHPDFIKGLKNFEKNFPDLTASKGVVYSGDINLNFEGCRVDNYRNLLVNTDKCS